MSQVDFKQLRVMIDEAMTYDDIPKARKLVECGVMAASQEENLGERMYFSAQIAIIEEDFVEALKFLDLAIKYNPSDGAAYNDRAICMVEMGEIDKVLDFFDMGISVEPDFATIYHNKGWYLNQSGKYREALQCFNKALELEPNRAVTYENIADCLVSLGHVEQAIEAYKTASEMVSPKNGDIKAQIDKLIQSLEKIQKSK